MQQLHNASDSENCARSVLEAVLAVLVAIRESAARRHKRKPGAPSTPADAASLNASSLIHLRALGVLRKRPGATLSAVADQLALTLSATSRMIDALVHKGLVKRVIPPGNRRTVSLMLTPAGTRALEKKLHVTQLELARELDRLAPDKRARIASAMDLLRQIFDKPPESPSQTP